MFASRPRAALSQSYLVAIPRQAQAIHLQLGETRRLRPGACGLRYAPHISRTGVRRNAFLRNLLAVIALSAQAEVKSKGRNEARLVNVCRNAGYGVAIGSQIEVHYFTLHRHILRQAKL